jgi:hypothetical protein
MMTEQSVKSTNITDESVNMDEAVVLASVSPEVGLTPDFAVDKKDTLSSDTTKDIDAKTANADSKEPDDETKKDTESSSKDEDKKKKTKPRVIKEKEQGIYTIQELEAANFFVEWYKGLRASAPYIIRLTKTFWSLSPMYSSALVAANLLKVVLPSFQLWIRKEFLDQVQFAAEGKEIRLDRLLVLVVLRLAEQGMKQGLEVATYIYIILIMLIVSDKIDSIMERRLGQVLDLQLVEAYLKLDTDQLSSRKVASQFSKVFQFWSDAKILSGKTIRESKSFKFGCSMVGFYSVYFNHCVIHIYFIETHVEKCNSTSSTQRCENGR